MTYQPIQNPLPISGTIETQTPDIQLDAFSRLRTSELSSLFNLTQLHDSAPLLVDTATNGTGAAAYSSGNASTIMSTAASGDWVVRQTFQRFPYYAGKSQLIFNTFSNFEQETNIEKQIGYFSSSVSTPFNTDYDGLFLRSDATGICVNVYRSGTQVERTYQSSWNVDTLDGNGASGITVDWSKDQILVMDFQYLGVGRVRWYLDIDGMLVKFHESMHSNILDTVYMKSPNQPLRWEIRQTGAGSGSMRQICASVSSEGAINSLGTGRGVDMGIAHVNASSAGTKYALIGIRLKTTHLDAQINILDFSALSLTTDSFYWSLMMNPTIAGTFTYSDVSNSAIQAAIGDTGGSNTVTGGIEMAAGYVYQQSSTLEQIDTALKIGSTIAGVRDQLVLCVTPLGSNADIIGSLHWKETI